MMNKKELKQFEDLKNENESLRDEIYKLNEKALMSEKNEIKKFHRYLVEKDFTFDTKYTSGKVSKGVDGFEVSYEQFGAQSTFCVEMPVYDKDQNLMGYLGIGLCRNLDHHTKNKLRVPVYYWSILQPTEHCVEGKEIFTYWQIQAMNENKGI